MRFLMDRVSGSGVHRGLDGRSRGGSRARTKANRDSFPDVHAFI